MAIKLAERAVDAVAALITASLPAVLTAIDTDRGDITLPQANSADIFTYQLRERGTHDSAVRIEVYEAESLAFISRYTDAGNSRAVYPLTVNVRVTVFNNSQFTEAQMWDIRRRYEAGLTILLLQNYGLGDSDDATQLGTVISVNLDGEQGIESVSTVAALEVKCEECIT